MLPTTSRSVMAAAHLTALRQVMPTLNTIEQSEIAKRKVDTGGEDMREGLACVLSVKDARPQVSSQTKDKLVSSEEAGRWKRSSANRWKLVLENPPTQEHRLSRSWLQPPAQRPPARPAEMDPPGHHGRSGLPANWRTAGARPGHVELYGRGGDLPAAQPSKAATVNFRRSCR